MEITDLGDSKQYADLQDKRESSPGS